MWLSPTCGRDLMWANSNNNAGVAYRAVPRHPHISARTTASLHAINKRGSVAVPIGISIMRRTRSYTATRKQREVEQQECAAEVSRPANYQQQRRERNPCCHRQPIHRLSCQGRVRVSHSRSSRRVTSYGHQRGFLKHFDCQGNATGRDPSVEGRTDGDSAVRGIVAMGCAKSDVATSGRAA